MAFIIGMVGLPAVGKSTLAEQISTKLGISHVNKDRIRDYLIESIQYFNGAQYSHSNPLISSVNSVVGPSSDQIIKELLGLGQNVIIDGYGKAKNQRDNYVSLTNEYEPIRIIIYVQEKEDLILERLKKRDSDSRSRWIENYMNKWKPTFNAPSSDECDHLILAHSSNHEAVISKIKEIIQKHQGGYTK